MRRAEPRLFPALIKHWRGRRGLSQLDLALEAGVSARHVSFLETGRAQPSRDMILRLATALAVPLRDQNALLQAAGFENAFDDSEMPAVDHGPVGAALERMLAQQEPFPMTILDRHYNILRINEGAGRFLSRIVLDPAALGTPVNVFRVLFDPRLARPFVVEWGRTARAYLSRLHREALERPEGAGLASLLRSLFEYPDVPRDWQRPDLSSPSEPCLSIRLRRGDLELAFLTTVAIFNAPQNVALDELRIEAYFPLDEATRRACAAAALPGSD